MAVTGQNMEKFLAKKDNHTAVNVTAADRVRKYPKGTLHADDGLLFCSTCNIVIDHLRKHKIDKHLESASHIRKVHSQNSLGKQQTLKTSFECKTTPHMEKVKICQAWIKACCAANIPLHKSDNKELRNFLQSKVSNGGAIPKCSQLRDYYLFDVYEVEKAELKKHFKGKNVALIVDELSDDEGRYVLDVMAVILDFDELSPEGNCVAYLLDTQFLSETNNKTVSQAIVRTVNEYDIEFDNVRVFNSDNVAYMKKAFNETLSCLFPLSVHITCNSHIVNLVASDFKKHFTELNEFLKCFRNLFFVPSGRKSRFLNFLRRHISGNARMPPNPSTKSWSAWFDSALYHAEYYFLFGEFFNEELSRGRHLASNSLLRLEEMYEDNSFMKKLHAQLNVVKAKGPTMLSYLNYFQEKIPHVTRVHEKMECLMHFLRLNAAGEEEDFSFCFEGNYKFSCKEKEEIIQVTTAAFKAAHSKLSKYVVDGAQPASKFLEQVRVLNPVNLVDCERSQGCIDSIPGIESVPKEEWQLYVNHIGPQAVKNMKDEGELDVKQFWKSKASSLPELYKLASCYCTTTIGSYDVERSFSAYNAILDGKRRALEQNTMKAFHFLNWNLRVKSTVQEEKEASELRVQEFGKEAVPQVEGSNTEKARKQSVTPPGNATDVTPKNLKKESELGQNSVRSSLSGKSSKRGNSKASDTTVDSAVQEESSPPGKDEKVQTVFKEAVQDQSSIPKKARKRNATSLVDDSDIASKIAKKGNDSGGKLGASLRGYFSSRPNVSDKKDRDAIPNVSQQDMKPVVHCGLDSNLASKISMQETTCNFPEHKQPLLDCLLDGTLKLNGSNIVDTKDLETLLGGQARNEDNYLNNFVIDTYLNLLIKNIPTKSKVESLEWEKFEKGIGGSKPVKKALKGKASILAQDVFLVPCNPGQSKHWFLLVVLPLEKKIVALDSLAGAFIKPTVSSAIRKMWDLLKQLDAALDLTQWSFSCNSPQDIPQQQNGFDCGVFICLYARSLLLQSPVVSSSSIQNFRKHMILELHEKEVLCFDGPAITEGQYYAVEYQKSFYFGRALNSSQDDSQIEFKFLHSTGARVFDWPVRDDIETCHMSCVFYGPITIVGVSPFVLPQLTEVEQVYQHIRKSRKKH